MKRMATRGSMAFCLGWRSLQALVLVMLTAAAQAGLPIAAPVAASPDAAQVTVMNRKVAVLRDSFLGVAPANRAKRFERAIAEMLDKGGAGVVSVQQAPQGNIVSIDGEFALILTPEDADTTGAETLETITESTQQALQGAIDATRESRNRSMLLRGAAESALATLTAVLAIWVGWRVRRATFVRTADLFESKAAGMQVAGAPLVHTSRTRALARGLVNVVAWSGAVILVYEWLVFVLTRFAYTRPWGEELGDFLVGVFWHIGSGVLGALPDLAIAAVILLLARGVIGAVRPIFDRVERGSGAIGWLDRDLAAPSRRIFSVSVWLFAVAMAYPYLPGAQSEAFKGITVLVGLMLTLGGSSLVGQGASGLILMYSRTIRIGDYVRIQEQEGTVTELSTFTAKIRTGLGEEISIPNSLIMGSVTKNYSRAALGQGFILDTVLTIGYDTPWRQVEAMLIEAAGRTEGILDTPKPKVFQTALSDFYVEYRLVCQAVPERPRTRAEVLHMLHANALDVFNEAGVQIMSPHYVGDPKAEKVVPLSQWYSPSARKA